MVAIRPERSEGSEDRGSAPAAAQPTKRIRRSRRRRGFQGPLDQVTSSLSHFQQTAVTLDRVFKILDHAPEADPALAMDPTYAPPPVPFDGGVRIEGLEFRYAAGGFTLKIP